MATVVPAEAISEEVRAFAAEWGVDSAVEAALDMTRKLFPGATFVGVALEPDSEMPDLWFVVYEVEAPDLTVEQAVPLEEQWCREILSIAPMRRLEGSDSSCCFTLSLRIGG